MKSNKIEHRSLNQELPALYAEELEMRLETDPLAVGGLLDEIMMQDCSMNSGQCSINDGDCKNNTGTCIENFVNCNVNTGDCQKNR